MGANMARHLKEVGYHISCVYDVRSENASELAQELGCSQAQDLASVTEQSEIVLTVVTDDAAMRAIFTEENLLKEAKGTTFINCATVTPNVHVEVEAAAQAVGASSLEACMASSITQAREGSLYLMVGGEESVFKAHEGLLKELSTSLRYIGSAGKAAQVKALVNMVMNCNTAALAEGLGLGEALGLDLNILCEVFSQTGANSRVLETDAEDMMIRDHECYFSASHAAKDSGIANALGEEIGMALPISIATEKQYDLMVQKGLGELDKSGVAELTFQGRGA